MSLSETRIKIPQGIRFPLTDKVHQLVIEGIARNLPGFIESIPIEFTPTFADEYQKKARELSFNFRPVIVASHTSHMDGAPLASVVKTITDFNNLYSPKNPLKGFFVPIASSMETGHQGNTVKEGLEKMKQIIESYYHLGIVSYTRDKDQRNYGLSKNTMRYILELTKRIKAGQGLAVFPEATMQGGRVQEKTLFGKDKRFGMQEFKNLQDIAEVIQRLGFQPLIIPVGINGGYQLENPDNNRFTKEFLAEIFLTRPTTTNLINAKVGNPVTLNEIAQEDINHFLGKMVARLLPQEARGVYT